MAAQKLNGAVVAQQIKDETIEELARLKTEGITPGLAVVLVGNDPASQVYVNSKVRTCAQLGIYSQKHELSADISTETLLELVESLNRDDRLDGILVQSPLPEQVDTQRILDAVDPEKDVDGFHPVNVGRLMMGQDGLQPCTPAGIIQLLVRSGIEIAGKDAVVIGRSDIVGKPMSLLLLHRNATVTICHSRTIDLAAHARRADILVAAIGRAAFVTPDFVKPGAVVVDVGVNRVESNPLVETLFSGAELDVRLSDLAKKGYTLIGDVDPRVGAVAGWLTPVPGGVGPLTISMLMKNTVQAAKRRRL